MNLKLQRGYPLYLDAFNDTCTTGYWRTDDGRFTLRRRKAGWMIEASLGLISAIFDTRETRRLIEQNGISGPFPTRRAACDALAKVLHGVEGK